MNLATPALGLGLTLALAGCNADQPRRATILYFHDAHQLAPVIDRHGDRGGFARLATLVARVRAAEPATLVAFGGDLAGGTLFGGQFRGVPQVEGFNRIGLDAAAFGQHDFDFGSAHTRALVAASRFPWLTSNLVESKTGAPFAGLPRVLVRSVGGLRLALLGLTDDFDTTLREDSVAALDLVDAARQALDGLTESVDAVLALAQTDTPGAERLLRAEERIDAVLAEEQAEDRSVVTWIGPRPITAAAGNLGSVIRLDLQQREREPAIAVRVLLVDGELPDDAALAELTTRYERRLEATLGEPLATLDTALAADGARSSESLLGSVVADAWRAACRSQVAMVNAGSLRADLPQGVVRRRDAASVLPFGNQIVVRAVPGRDLQAALEHGLAGVAARRGTLLHVSGLTYRATLARDGAAVLDAVSVGGAPLEPERTYRVALSSYLARGGDGFNVFTAAPAVNPGCVPDQDVEALAAHLRRAGDAAAVALPVAGRVVIRRIG